MPHPEASPAAEVKGAAQCAGQSVSMSIKVGEDGLVKSSRVLSAPHPDCARAATDVIGRWRFKPAQDAEGRPVETTISVVVPFSESP
jgi:TonB family protein